MAVTQHRTDPRLGPRMLDLMRSDRNVQEAVDTVAASTPHRAWRQLAAMDTAGTCAAFSGAAVTEISAVAPGRDCLAVGNMLVKEDVAPALVAAFVATAGDKLAVRLIQALQAGEAAGGETGDLRSAALLVVGREEISLVDLRIDSDPAPLVALHTLWLEYEPWEGDFVRRVLDPDGATGEPDPDHRESSTTT